MAESKSICVYLPDNIQKELDEIKETDGIDNTSQYVKDLIHVAHMAGGIRALERRLLAG